MVRERLYGGRHTSRLPRALDLSISNRERVAPPRLTRSRFAHVSRSSSDMSLPGPATGGHGKDAAESLHALLGRAVAEAFPQVGAALQQPWFQQTLQSPEASKPLWEEMLLGSPRRRENVKIKFLHKKLEDGPVADGPWGSPATGGPSGSQPSSSSLTEDPRVDPHKASPGQSNTEPPQGCPGTGSTVGAAGTNTTATQNAQHGDIGDMLLALGNAPTPKAMKAMRAMKAKTPKCAAKSDDKPRAKKSMKTMKAMKTASSVMKTALYCRKTASIAMGVRGEKNQSFLKFKMGPRLPFWYGKSKVNTVYTSPSHGRWRVYKNSPRDKVESSFGFCDPVSMRDQWGQVVKLLKRCNP